MGISSFGLAATFLFTKFFHQEIFAASYSLIFSCAFIDTEWPILGDKYTCECTFAILDREKIANDGNGPHEKGKSNFDVVGLKYWDQKGFVKIAPGLGQRFPNLKALAWQMSNLKEISANDLEQFPKLEVLELSDNKLEVLDGNLFMHTPKLKRISFFDNYLDKIEMNILDDLTQLQYANFEDNNCINLKVESKSGLEQLKQSFNRTCYHQTTLGASTSKRISVNEATTGFKHGKNFASIKCQLPSIIMLITSLFIIQF